MIFAVRVQEKVVHQFTNKHVFGDVRCERCRAVLQNRKVSFSSLDRKETPDWSHKRMKITSVSEAQAPLLPANIWEGGPATCVSPVKQQYFLSGGQTELHLT